MPDFEGNSCSVHTILVRYLIAHRASTILVNFSLRGWLLLLLASCNFWLNSAIDAVLLVWIIGTHCDHEMNTGHIYLISVCSQISCTVGLEYKLWTHNLCYSVIVCHKGKSYNKLVSMRPLSQLQHWQWYSYWPGSLFAKEMCSYLCIHPAASHCVNWLTANT